ncbi:MAG: tape measure protein [Pedobacter sp.]
MSVTITGGDLRWDAGINLSQFRADMKEIQDSLADLAKRSKTEASDMQVFAKKAAQAAAGYFSIQQATNFVQSMIKVRGEFQQIEAAYRVMLGSKEKADKLMAESVKLAAVTPFTLQDVASGSKQLLAYGFAAGDVTKNLEMLGNIASGVGSQLGDIVYLYGTLKASGKVTQVDINQFAGRGIPIYQALADVMKVNVDQVREYVSAGKVGFPQIEAAFNKLTGAGGQFYNLMQEQSKTLTGQLSNLEDAWSRMLNELGKKNEGIFADFIGGAISLVDNYQKVIDVIGVLVLAYGAYRAALLLEIALTNAAAASKAGLTVQTVLLMGAEKLLTVATTAMNRVFAVSSIAAYTAIITALGLAVYSLTKVVGAGTAAQNALNEVSEESQKTANAERRSIDQLIGVIKNKKSSVEETDKAYQKLKESTGDVLKGYSKEEIATGKAAKSLDDYIKKIRDAAAARRAFAEFNELAEKMDELDSKGIKAVDTFTRVGRSMRNAAADLLTGNIFSKELWNTDAANAEILKQEKGVLDAQMEALKKKYGDKFNEIILGDKEVTGSSKAGTSARNKAYYEKIIKDNTDLLDALDKGSKDFNQKAAPLKAKIKAAQQELLAFDVSGKGDRANNELQKWAEKRLEIIKKISDAGYDASARAMSQNEQEIEDNRAKYRALRDELEKFNREAKRERQQTLGRDIFKLVDNAEAKEEYSIRYRQETEAIKTSIEEHKKLYADFEQYKADFGEEKAKERYKNEIKVNRTFLEKLEIDYSMTLAQGYLSGFSTTLQERLSVQGKAINEEKKAEDQKHSELLKSLMSYEQTRKVLIETYERNRKKLVEGSDAQIVLDRLHKEALSRLDDENVQKLDAYKKLFDGIEKLSTDAARRVIENARGLLLGKLSPQLGQQISDKLREAKKELENRIPEKLNKIGTELTGFAIIIGRVDSGFGAWVNTLGGVLSNISQVKGQIDGFQTSLDKKSILGSIGNGLGVFSTFMGIGKAFAGLLGNEARKRDEQAKNSSDLQLKQTEAVTKALDRQLELINKVYGTEKIVRYAEAIKGIGSATEEVSGQLSAMLKLTGDPALDALIAKINSGQVNGLSLNEQLLLKKNEALLNTLKVPANDIKELQRLLDSGLLDAKSAQLAQSLIDLKKKADEAANAIKQELTGTSFESFADGIVNMFADINASAADFGKNFEDIMKKAILNSFKTKAIADQLQKFYDQFADFSASGGQLTSDEIAKLKVMYDKIITEGKAKFDELQKVTGISFANSATAASANSLQGAYATASQDSITLLAGHTSAMRLAQLEANNLLKAQGMTLAQQMQIAMNQLNVAMKIEANTLRTANNTDRLSNIEAAIVSLNNKVGSSNSAAKAAGLQP